jgi:hypothetical protein
LTKYSTGNQHIFIFEPSVADPGCLSRILIFIHPGSRIQEQQKRKGKNLVVLPGTFFVATKSKIFNYFIFELLKKIKLAHLQRIKESSQKYGLGSWGRNPGSGKPIPDPGVKKAPDPGSSTLFECCLQSFKLHIF